MKALFVALLAFSFTFFIGCQDSFITDPVSTDNRVLSTEDAQNLVYKDIIHNFPMLIEVIEKIFDPSHPQRGYAALIGIVRYNSELFETTAPTTPPNLKGIKINAYVNFTLDVDCPKKDVDLKVVSLFKQIIYFSNSNEQVVYFYKTFKVSGCCCKPLLMHIKFQVDQKEMKIVEMKLIADET